MLDFYTLFLFAGATIAGISAYLLRAVILKAGAITKFQTYSNSVDESILDYGIFTKHGIVYDANTKSVTAQHARSELYYENS
jgi:hypothetical protein